MIGDPQRVEAARGGRQVIGSHQRGRSGWPTVRFGSPATVTAVTSPPEASNAISWTCHNGKPVSRSTLGWPVSNAIRASGARVHTNDTAAVSIRSFIDKSFLLSSCDHWAAIPSAGGQTGHSQGICWTKQTKRQTNWTFKPQTSPTQFGPARTN